MEGGVAIAVFLAASLVWGSPEMASKPVEEAYAELEAAEVTECNHPGDDHPEYGHVVWADCIGVDEALKPYRAVPEEATRRAGRLTVVPLGLSASEVKPDQWLRFWVAVLAACSLAQSTLLYAFVFKPKKPFRRRSGKGGKKNEHQ